MICLAQRVIEKYHSLPPEVNIAALIEDYEPRLLYTPYVTEELVTKHDLVRTKITSDLFSLNVDYLTRIYARDIYKRYKLYKMDTSGEDPLLPCDHRDCIKNLSDENIDSSKCKFTVGTLNGMHNWVACKLPACEYIKYYGRLPIPTHMVGCDPVGYYNEGLIDMSALLSIITERDIMANPYLQLPQTGWWQNDDVSVKMALTYNIRDAYWNEDLRVNIGLLHPQLQAKVLHTEPKKYTIWFMNRYVKSHYKK